MRPEASDCHIHLRRSGSFINNLIFRPAEETQERCSALNKERSIIRVGGPEFYVRYEKGKVYQDLEEEKESGSNSDDEDVDGQDKEGRIVGIQELKDKA